MFAKLEVLWQKMILSAQSNYADNSIINKNKYDTILKYFREKYGETKRKYMNKEVVLLDIHKVAAIIMYSVIKTKVIESNNASNSKLYFSNYELAISAGLSFMQYEINEELNKKGEKPISRFEFPDAIYSKKKYLEDFRSLLYYKDREDNLDIITLSNILYLIDSYNRKTTE